MKFIKYSTLDKKLELNLDADLVIIYGKNGAGKSTIAKALAEKIQNNTSDNLIKIELDTDNEKTVNNYQETSLIKSFSETSSNSINYETIKEIILDDNENFYATHKFLNNDNSLYNENLLKKSFLEKQLRTSLKEIELVNIQNMREKKLSKENDVLSKELKTLKIQVATLKKKAKNLSKATDLHKKLYILEEKFSLLKNNISDEKERTNTKKMISDELNKNFPMFANINENFNTNLDNLHKLFDEFKILSYTIDIQKKNNSNIKKKTFFSLLLFNSATFFSSTIVYFFNFLQLPNNTIISKLIIAISLIITFIVTVIIFKINKKNNPDELEKQINEIAININTQFKEFNSDKQNLSHDEIYPILLQYFENYIHYIEKKDELLLINENSLKYTEIKELKSNLSDIKIEIKNITNSIERLTEHKVNSLNTDKIKSLISQNRIALETNNRAIIKKEDLIQKITKDLSKNKNNNLNNEKEILLNDIDSYKNQIEEINDTIYSITLIKEALSNAVLERETKSLENLCSLTLEIFNDLTINNYSKTITIETINKIIKEDNNTEDLSLSVLYNLLLSLKFSITDFFIDENYTVPLILDEPFSFMDIERVEKLKSLVEETSKIRQVIIFTHSKDYKNWGHYVEM